MMQQLYRNNRELLQNVSSGHFKKVKNTFKGSFKKSLLRRSNPAELQKIKERSERIMNRREVVMWAVLLILIALTIGLMIRYFRY